MSQAGTKDASRDESQGEKPKETPAAATQRRVRLARDVTSAIIHDKIVGRAHGRLSVEYTLKDGVVELVELVDVTRIK